MRGVFILMRARRVRSRSTTRTGPAASPPPLAMPSFLSLFPVADGNEGRLGRVVEAEGNGLRDA